MCSYQGLRPKQHTVLQVLGGKDESGAWATAKAKEYPSSLNRAIALSVVDYVKDVHGSSGRSYSQSQLDTARTQSTTQFAKYITTHDIYDAAMVTTYGADYVRRRT